MPGQDRPRKPTRRDSYSAGWQDVTSLGKMSLRAITQYLQESAWKHAREHGFGYDLVSSQDALWVMGRLEVKMTDYPVWEDQFDIETWHRGYEGLTAYRDFNIYNKHNQRIGSASSDWFVIGRTNRRPKRLDFLDPFFASALKEKSMHDEPLRIDAKRELPPLLYHTVVFSELDFHGHVNTSRYFEWVINACDPEILFQQQIERFGIRFLSECNLHDHIEISGIIGQKEAWFKGFRTQDGKAVFAATLQFA